MFSEKRKLYWWTKIIKSLDLSYKNLGFAQNNSIEVNNKTPFRLTLKNNKLNGEYLKLFIERKLYKLFNLLNCHY